MSIKDTGQRYQFICPDVPPVLTDQYDLFIEDGYIKRIDRVERFTVENNAIEGIFRDPTTDEVEYTDRFIKFNDIDELDVRVIQRTYAPHAPLRNTIGMDVRVGDHVPIRGGADVKKEFEDLIENLNKNYDVLDPQKTHGAFETLHPFMDGNGRTGRTLWAWHMRKQGRSPFALSFLHQFYYQTLENVDGR